MALEIISRIIFSSDSAQFIAIMERASRRYQRERIFDLPNFVPLLDRLWGSYKRHRGRQIFKELDDSIDRLIAKRVGEGRHSDNDFLGRLMAERDLQTGTGLSAQEVHGEELRSSARATKAWHRRSRGYGICFRGIRMQEARLHSELDQVLAGRTPCLEDLAKLPYTRMVIAEALRLYPPVHAMAWRGSLEDDEICGLKIDKRSRPSPSFRGVHHIRGGGIIPTDSIRRGSRWIGARDGSRSPIYPSGLALVFVLARLLS